MGVMPGILEIRAGSSGASTMAGHHRHVRLRARRLLRLLADKKNILITTHEYPDPDALASVLGMHTLLTQKLPDAVVQMSVKGQIGGGLNQEFINEAKLKLLPWNEKTLKDFDAIVLLDVQPAMDYCPLPTDILPLVVVDHHSNRGRRLKLPFSDVRSEVGACASIIFSYFAELQLPVKPSVGAVLLFGIESDLSGSAGTPGELDNMALSSLHLSADMPKLYRMRYVDLPQSYYIAYARALQNAVYYDSAIASYMDQVDSMEKPAVMADFLLRFDNVQWALVSGVLGNRMLLSLRTSSNKFSAAEMMRRLVRHLGTGGGHRTKAGGVIHLENGSPAEIERIRKILRRRYLRALRIKQSRGQRLVPAE